MKAIHRLILMIAVVVLVLVSSSLFVVRQGQGAFVQQLGKVLTDDSGEPVMYGPGLHFKFPFINAARLFDTRLNGFSSGQFSVITAKQTFLEVEYYAKWRIQDLVLFYTRTGGSAAQAVTLMEPKINDIIRAEFGKRNSDEIISTDRNRIMGKVLTEARSRLLEDYGIQIIDVQLQSTKLPERVLESVFKRMASERTQFANNKRAEGEKAAESIRAKADQKVVVIKAKANRQAAIMRAEGDQEAAEIYAAAYQRDPDFYAFYRSLQAYKDTFSDKDDVVVLSPQSQFFDYFNQAARQAK